MELRGALYARGETIDFQKIQFSLAMAVRGALYARGKRSVFKKSNFP